MRIIAGSARRTELEVAADSTTRPFLEMARGALFNSLMPRLPGARVLDVYAGSGALGLEALSRGADSCVFVERDPRAASALARNIAKCGFTAEAKILRQDAARALAGLADGEYDIVLLDPPFPDLPNWRVGGPAEETMRHAARILAADGVVMLRIEDKKVAPPEWPGLALADERRYGRSRVCRYGNGTGGDL